MTDPKEFEASRLVISIQINFTCHRTLNIQAIYMQNLWVDYELANGLGSNDGGGCEGNEWPNCKTSYDRDCGCRFVNR